MMPRLVALLAALLVTLPATAQESIAVVATEVEAPADDRSLEELKWVARPLVVFADTPDDPRFIQQMRMLAADPDPLTERNVVIRSDADPAANGPLRTQLRPRGFGLVLIDVDGRVAQRRPVPTSVREIVNMIDRMPSRREEIGSHRP
jgi:hypothetical protein